VLRLVEQRHRLIAEGVPIVGARVAISEFRWDGVRDTNVGDFSGSP